jgi:hypothetical protein
MSVQPLISTIPCKILYLLANPVLPFLMFSWPFASPSAPGSTASYQKIARPIIFPATSLESTLLQVFIPLHLKFPRINTYKKPRGRVPLSLTRLRLTSHPSNRNTSPRVAFAASAKYELYEYAIASSASKSTTGTGCAQSILTPPVRNGLRHSNLCRASSPRPPAIETRDSVACAKPPLQAQ